MIWTHIYDFILKVLTLLLSMLILLQIPVFETHAVACILTGMIVFYLSYYFLIRTVSTFLYCRFTLKMPVTFSQAKQLNDAFSPIYPFYNVWLPMNEIRGLNPQTRFSAALNIYKNWKDETARKKLEQKSNVKKTKYKLLRILYFVLIGYSLLAGFLNLPPANFVTAIINHLFESEGYNPILNVCILILPIVVIFRLINKDIIE